MWVCKNCNEKLEDSFDSCWNCGRKEGETSIKEEKVKETKQSTSSGLQVSMDNNSNNQTVIISDIKMPFGSMVEFMVKWVIASIPAIIILIIIFNLITAILVGLGFGVFKLFT